jgi:hypothetical protein
LQKPKQKIVGKWGHLGGLRERWTYVVVQRVLTLYERGNHEQIIIVPVPHVWELVLPRWNFQADVGRRFQVSKAITGKVTAHWSIALNGCDKVGKRPPFIFQREGKGDTGKGDTPIWATNATSIHPLQD